MKKLVLITTLIILMLSINVSFSYADDIDTGDYESIYSTEGVSDLRNKSGIALNIVQIVGSGVSIIALIALGIKYMLSSPSEKADVKTKLVPYVIGIIIFFGASNLVTMVIRFAEGF